MRKSRLNPDDPYDAAFTAPRPAKKAKKARDIQVSFRTSPENHRRILLAARLLAVDDPDMTVGRLLTVAFDAYVKTLPADTRKRLGAV
jgi:hypothetical protein